MQKRVDFSEAKNTKYPEAIVYAVARDKNGKANPMTVGWSMTASGNPPMLAVALAHKRHTLAAIRHSKCFTVVFPACDMAEEAMLFGTKSGRDIDKLAESATPTQDADIIDSVILTDAVANFECTLESETEAGDHVIIVGKVVASHINTEKKQRLYTTAPGYKMGPPR